MASLLAALPIQAQQSSSSPEQCRAAGPLVSIAEQFVVADEDDGDIERRATLESTGIDADATGEAEVEFSKAAPSEQEVGCAVRHLEPGVALTLAIDGTDLAAVTADDRGRVEIELDVAIPGRTE